MQLDHSRPSLVGPAPAPSLALPSVIVAAAMPPPVVGQSLASAALVRQLEARGVPHRVVDLTRPIENRLSLGYVMQRAGEVTSYPLLAARAARELAPPHVLYLQLAQSHRGMIRDLPLLTLAATLGWPTVLHLHGGTFREAWESAPTPLRTVMRPLLGRTSRIVVLEPRLQAMFDGLVDPERICVVPNSVEHAITDAALEPARFPADGALEVLFLSNLMEPKGYVTVLEAARLCRERGLPHRFVLAGAITNETVVDPHAFIAEHGLGQQVRYLGPVYGTAKVALLRSSHVFVLPSAYQEGQPISILEAMHFGMPVISSHCGGIPDIFECPAQQDLLVPTRDPEALVACLERLAGARDLYERIGQANFLQAAGRYTESSHGAAMVEVLAAAAAPARSS